MKRYIALLRGINISGKNKISMAELKTGFAEAGYTAVSTYLNSGNVAFDSDAEDKGSISENIMAMIKDKAGYSRTCNTAGGACIHTCKCSEVVGK